MARSRLFGLLFRILIIVLILALPFGGSFLAAAKSGKQKPRITMRQARVVALKAVPGGKIKSGELETESGRRIYSFDIKVGKEIREVWVDPSTGEVIKNEVETPQQERTEKARDKN